MENNIRKCIICGETKKQMIKGESGFICKECVENAHRKIIERKNEKEKIKLKNELRPSKLKNILDDYIIKQDDAKKKVAVAIYNQFKIQKRNKNKTEDDIDIKKSGIILCGPTGCGKTAIIETLANKLGVPFAIADCSSMTENGYVGNDPQICVQKLLEAAGGDIKKAENGIIFLDEIDKLGRKGENPSITRDVSGEGVQQALLKIVEGSDVTVPDKGMIRINPSSNNTVVNTKNILFIAGGAFEGIEKIIAKRLQGKTKMGFGASIIDKDKMKYNDLIKQITVQDLEKFGMMPELLGRFPVIADIEELLPEDLVRIMTEPKNAIVDQYKELFKDDGVELILTEDAIKEIANIAYKRHTGARSLKSIMENILLEYMFSIPDDCSIKSITIDKDVILGKSEPQYKYNETITTELTQKEVL